MKDSRSLSGFSTDNRHLYLSCASLPPSMRKFIMNVCLNLSNFRGNTDTLLPSAVAGRHDIMSSAGPEVGISG